MREAHDGKRPEGYLIGYWAKNTRVDDRKASSIDVACDLLTLPPLCTAVLMYSMRQQRSGGFCRFDQGRRISSCSVATQLGTQ